MQILETIMRDPLFGLHARAYVNMRYLDEGHVAWCAQNFARWAGQQYGAVTMLMHGHNVVVTLREENGFISVGRGPIPDTPAGLRSMIELHSGIGYIVLYEGKTDEINSALAGSSDAVDDRQQEENTPLLH